MQSPTATTFNFSEEYTLDHPHRRIDQLVQAKTMFKKVIVIDKGGNDMTGKSSRTAILHILKQLANMTQSTLAS